MLGIGNPKVHPATIISQQVTFRRFYQAPSHSREASFWSRVKGNHDAAISGPGSATVGLFVLGCHMLDDCLRGGYQSLIAPVFGMVKSGLDYVAEQEAKHFVERMGPFIKPVGDESLAEAKERVVADNSAALKTLNNCVLTGVSFVVSPVNMVCSELGAQIFGFLPSLNICGKAIASQVIGYQLGGQIYSALLSDKGAEVGCGSLEESRKPLFPFMVSAEPLGRTTSSAISPDGGVLLDDMGGPLPSLFSQSVEHFVLSFLMGNVIASVDNGHGKFCLREKPSDCMSFEDVFSINWQGFMLPDSLPVVRDFCMTIEGYRAFCALTHRIPGLTGPESQAVQMYTQGYPTTDGTNVYKYVNALLRGDEALIAKLDQVPGALQKAITLTFLALSGLNKSPLVEGPFYRMVSGACTGIHNGLGAGDCKKGEVTTLTGITGAALHGPLTQAFAGGTLVIQENTKCHDVTGPHHMRMLGADIECVPGMQLVLNSVRRFSMAILRSKVVGVEHRNVGGHHYSLFNVEVKRAGRLLFTTQHVVMNEEMIPYNGKMQYFKRDPRVFEAQLRTVTDPFFVLMTFYRQSESRILQQDLFDQTVLALDFTPKRFSRIVKGLCQDFTETGRFWCQYFRGVKPEEHLRVITASEHK
jgi:hypothetical protein